MRQEGTIGAAVVLAIAAIVGVSTQTGPKTAENSDTATHAKLRTAKTVKTAQGESQPGCRTLAEQLGDFLEAHDLPLPPICFEASGAPRSLAASSATVTTT